MGEVHAVRAERSWILARFAGDGGDPFVKETVAAMGLNQSRSAFPLLNDGSPRDTVCPGGVPDIRSLSSASSRII